VFLGTEYIVNSVRLLFNSFRSCLGRAWTKTGGKLTHKALLHYTNGSCIWGRWADASIFEELSIRTELAEPD